MSTLLHSQRRFSPAAERNTPHILGVLKKVLPRKGLILEVASGSGQHVSTFARAFDELVWQPSEREKKSLESIESWRTEADCEAVLKPIVLDVHWDLWPMDRVAAILCINMVHIAPWSATEALFQGAQRHLDTGPLILYGPFRFGGHFTAESNAQFSASLQAQDPCWGVRDTDDLEALAAGIGFELRETYALPANNHCLIFSRVSS